MSLIAASQVFSLPQDLNIVSGEASLSLQSPEVMEIIAKDRSILHWNEFSIETSERVSFIQENGSSCILNRVVGQSPTHILGRLESNGKILIINPQGILFGSDAQIDMGSLVASTLDLIDSEFLDRKDWHFSGPSENGIANLGSIVTEGDLVLISRQVNNSGSLNSANGVVGIGGASEVLLCADREKRIFIKPGHGLGSVSQKGHIRAPRIEFQVDGSPYELAFFHEGQSDALYVDEKDGGIFLSVPSGDALIQGSLTGQRIELIGQRIGLQNEALIDVSGPSGGGTVLIGGDFQGNNPDLQNAEAIFMDPNARIIADATMEGDGGKVVLWSDYSTEMRGQISARGGPQGGNGGFVEVSSKGNLDYQGLSDLRSELGQEGTLLLDPRQITITGATAGVALGNCGFPANTYASTIIAGTLLNTTLTTQLGLASTIITTFDGGCPFLAGTGDIIVSSPVLWTSNFSLTLNAARDILVTSTGDIRNQGVGNGSVTLQAVRDITVLADVRNANSVNGAGVSGNVTLLSTGGNIVIGSPVSARNLSVCARKGTTSVTANVGSISIFGGNVANAFATIGEATQAPLGGGGVTPIASGPIIVSCAGNLNMTSGNLSRASAYIGKGGNFLNGGAAGTNRNINATNITLNVGGDMTMISGLAIPPGGADCYIANGGYQSVSGPFLNRNGNIDVNVHGNLRMTSQGGYCYIGLGSRAAVNGGNVIITLQIGGNMTMDLTPTADPANSFSAVYSFGDLPLGHRMNIRAYIGGNLTLDGRNGQSQFRTFNNSTTAAIPAQYIVHTGGEINLIGGTQGSACFFNPDGAVGLPPNFLWEIWSVGRIRAYNSTSTLGGVIFTTLNTPYDTVDVRSASDVVQGGGQPSTSNFISTRGPLSIQADASFTTGQLWPAQTALVNGVNIFTGTPLGADSPAVASDGIGGVAFDMNHYAISPVTFPVTPSGVSPPLFPPISSPATSPSIYNFPNVFISSADTFSNMTPADFLNIGTAVGSARFQSNVTDITIQGFRNTLITDASLTSARDLVVNTQNNMTLTNATISAIRDVNLVVDNQAPTPPLIGPGAFVMDGTSQISSTTGSLGIFTARRNQNTVSPTALFNGIAANALVPVFPGTLYVDTAREKWAAYFNVTDFFGNNPVRFFYKDVLQAATQQAEIIISELIRDDFPPLNFPYYGMNDFYGWPSKFWIIYELFKEGSDANMSLSSYQNRPTEKYFFRKKNELLVQPYREFVYHE